MINTLTFICLIVFSTASLVFGQTEKEVLSSFCQLELSESVKQGNNTFTDIYYFNIDEEGKPKNIRERSVKFTKIGNVESCLANWKLKGFSQDSVFRVEFSWKHAVGWTQMRIITKEFSQTVLNRGKACPNDEK